MTKTKILLIITVMTTLSLNLQGKTGTQSTSSSSVRKAETLSAWTKTPPLGWNSFDCYGSNVLEGEIKANADYMAENLKDYGWEYIVNDIRWHDVYHESSHSYNLLDASYSIDEYGRLLPDTVRFPSAAGGTGFKALADYVHDKGLKYGVHIMRGIPRKAVEENTPIYGTDYHAQDIYKTDSLCTWLGDMYTVDCTKPGAQEYYNSVFNLFAEWGVDFVKIDDLSSPYHEGEVTLIANAIAQCGREIIFSASPGDTPLENAEHVSTHANMWRVIGDLWDRWNNVKYLMGIIPDWMPYISEGHYPDCDMLPLGHIGIRAEIGEDRDSDLSEAEARSLLTQMVIARSPLMLGCDLPTTDEATMAMFKNTGALYVNQHSSGNKQAYRYNDLITWTADDEATGDKFVALFNAQDSTTSEKALFLLSTRDLGLSGSCTVTDIWTSEDLGTADGEFSIEVAAHDAMLLRFHQEGDGGSAVEKTVLDFQNTTDTWGTNPITANEDGSVTIEMSDYGSVAWLYTLPTDISGYDYITVTLKSLPDKALQLRVFDTDGRHSEVGVDGLKLRQSISAIQAYDEDDGVYVDPTKVYMIQLWGFGGEYNVESVVLSSKSDDIFDWDESQDTFEENPKTVNADGSVSIELQGYGSHGWIYSPAVDLSEYSAINVELADEAPSGTNLKVWDSDGRHSEAWFSGTSLTQSLTSIKDVDTDEDIDVKNISRIEFWSFGGTLKVRSISLVKDATLAISAVQGASERQAGGIYTLTGQKVNAAAHGVYIIDGRKVVVK